MVDAVATLAHRRVVAHSPMKLALIFIYGLIGVFVVLILADAFLQSLIQG